MSWSVSGEGWEAHGLGPAPSGEELERLIREQDAASHPPHTHSIPVDASFGTDEAAAIEAWKELCIFGHRVTDTGRETWAVIRCDGQECAGIERAS